jgi:serine/alanine adding enzyme
VREERLVYIDTAPNRLTEAGVPSELVDWKPLAAARFSLRLDLTRTHEQLLAGLRKTARQELRRAERAKLVVRPASGQTEIEKFLELYLRLAGRKKFSADSPIHLRRVLRWILDQPSRGTLLLAQDGATTAGGAVILRTAKCCWYVWGASDKYPQFSAGHALQWHALLWAQSQGCTEYDFGGYTPGATSGPAWFKEGFGGRVIEFVPAHRFVLRRRPYRLFRLLSRAR